MTDASVGFGEKERRVIATSGKSSMQGRMIEFMASYQSGHLVLVLVVTGFCSPLQNQICGWREIL